MVVEKSWFRRQLRVNVRVFAFFAVFFLFGDVYAMSPTESLKQALSAIHTWQADFTQKAYGENGRLEAESSGHCAIKRPGYFYWRIDTPNQQTIYLNPKHTWVVDPDLMQATRQSSSKLVTSNNPVSLLVGALDKTLSQYRVSRVATKGDVSYVLIPLKQDDAPFQRLSMTLRNHVLSSMQVTTVLSSDVVFSFTHIVLNKSISNTFFHYTPAPGMDVLKQG